MHEGFQREIWAHGVGDDWYKRNKAALGNRDLASDALQHLDSRTNGINPNSILEVGAANGWRLKKLKDHFGCDVRGIDISKDAINDAVDGIQVDYGYAHDLPYPDKSFDIVIFGFCLCFVSPEDWLSIVSESNRVLRHNGLIVLYDFMGTRFVKRRMNNIMADKKLEERPVYLYNFDWPSLWISHPGYKVAIEILDMTKAEVATVLRKDMEYLISDDLKVA